MGPRSISVARNLCWGPDNRDAESVERGGCETVPLPSRLGVLGECRKLPQWSPGKRVLDYLELEKTHLIATNLSYLIFLRHIFSHIHIHNY